MQRFWLKSSERCQILLSLIGLWRLYWIHASVQPRKCGTRPSLSSDFYIRAVGERRQQ